MQMVSIKSLPMMKLKLIEVLMEETTMMMMMTTTMMIMIESMRKRKKIRIEVVIIPVQSLVSIVHQHRHKRSVHQQRQIENLQRNALAQVMFHLQSQMKINQVHLHCRHHCHHRISTS